MVGLDGFGCWQVRKPEIDRSIKGPGARDLLLFHQLPSLSIKIRPSFRQVLVNVHVDFLVAQYLSSHVYVISDLSGHKFNYYG